MTMSAQTNLATDRLGVGEPALLMLPSWGGDRSCFRELLPLTGSHRTSIAMDWRGHGESERTAADFGSAELVSDAMAVIERAGLERVVPVATSHGGWIAIELQRQLGVERVPGIVSLSWTVLGPPPGFFTLMDSLRDPEHWQQARAEMLHTWTLDAKAAPVRDYVAGMTSHGFDMWSRAAREIAADFVAHRSPIAALQQAATPFLHLYAQPNDEAYLHAQLALRERRPWFHVEQLPGQTYFPALEQPELTAAAIEAFVSELG
ncbi:alpha/beta hydrolase [Jatrophihabitans sp.]|uniref:alpha/beta fold hydrolase n=1 Tax=Jatrophihabitans sp. TaxID=1932789 RepID=UPI0030C6E5D4|nr:1H-3-hydroxy-4-oxoquinaldine 2,4-dioxygenase [Jatrophihabitans sp.]